MDGPWIESALTVPSCMIFERRFRKETFERLRVEAVAEGEMFPFCTRDVISGSEEGGYVSIYAHLHLLGRGPANHRVVHHQHHHPQAHPIYQFWCWI